MPAAVKRMKAVEARKAMNSQDPRVRKSLKFSILDGAFAASMIGFGESFFAAFAVFLRANNIQLGLLSALPQALGSFSQLLSNVLIKAFRSRKRLVCIAASLQGAMFIPIALVFYMGEWSVFYLILFACLYWVFGMVLGPAWNSWMGDLTEAGERGSYFGVRSKITGSASFFTFLLAGYILQQFSDGTKAQYLGFAMIFSLALLSRIVSIVFLAKKYEPAYEIAQEAEFSLFEFIRQARFRNYGLFVLYLSLMNFSVYLSVPFFTPYMLKDLEMSYLTFTLLHAASIIVKLFSVPVWGRMSDRFGSRRVLSLAGFLMPAVPALWLFSKDVYYIAAVQVYSGFVWAGFDIASFNFIFDTTSPRKRATCVAYYNVINGLAILCGAITGGLIIRYNDFFWSKYLLVFLISAVMRYLASFIFLPKLKEVRQVEAIPYAKLFFKVVSAMPTMGLLLGLVSFRKKDNRKETES